MLVRARSGCSSIVFRQRLHCILVSATLGLVRGVNGGGKTAVGTGDAHPADGSRIFFLFEAMLHQIVHDSGATMRALLQDFRPRRESGVRRQCPLLIGGITCELNQLQRERCRVDVCFQR